MLNVTSVLTSIVSDLARAHYSTLFPGGSGAYLDLATSITHTALDTISKSDALYHNVEHTAHVTIVGLEILRALHLHPPSLTPSAWANSVIALTCHDIGYVRGVCRADTSMNLVAGPDGQMFKAAAGTSDAVLMPIHVNRGKRYIEERFLDNALVDVPFVKSCIERTRFPVPDDSWYAQTNDLPGLVRAADLIGQLSDPRYLYKLSAIFFEFEEIGFNQSMGYCRPGDLLRSYPDFFEKSVVPYIEPACDLLERTQEGREILRQLYDNLSHARAALPHHGLRSAANG